VPDWIGFGVLPPDLEDVGALGRCRRAATPGRLHASADAPPRRAAAPPAPTRAHGGTATPEDEDEMRAREK